MWHAMSQAIAGFFVLVALIGAGQEEGPVTIEGWGEVNNPAGDCQITPQEGGGKLTIKVPGTLHDLSREFEDMTAPRILRDVEGDFVAEVKVVGPMGNQGQSTSRHYQSYHGAGLLLWVDGDTYMRLERSVVYGGPGDTRPFVNWDFRKDAKNMGNHAVKASDQPMTLRLERRGDRILCSYSADGERWTDLEPWEVDFPAKLRIGVAAVSTSAEPLVAELEGFRVRPSRP